MAQRRKAKKVRPEVKAQPAGPSSSEAEPGSDAVREATRLHVAGKLIEALPFYEQAVAHHRSPALLNNYGAALRDLKQSAEAVPLFREAANQDKDYADARLNLGLSLMDV